MEEATFRVARRVNPHDGGTSGEVGVSQGTPLGLPGARHTQVNGGLEAGQTGFHKTSAAVPMG